jgi:hypothetical protein
MTQLWTRDSEGIITFSVQNLFPANKRSGVSVFTQHFDSRKIFLARFAREDMDSVGFGPVSLVDSTRVAVIPGTLFGSQGRCTTDICAEAVRRGWRYLCPNIGYLIGSAVGVADMEQVGLYSIISLPDPSWNRYPVQVDRLGGYRGNLTPRLDSIADVGDDGWNEEIGFAFALPD